MKSCRSKLLCLLIAVVLLVTLACGPVEYALRIADGVACAVECGDNPACTAMCVDYRQQERK